MKDIIVIGSGFSGISAAAFMGSKGYSVRVLEKNSCAGGRARNFSTQGFVFDMGPSWYWMPDVFERFFQSFGKSASDYYTLKKLDPAFTVVFKNHNEIIVPGEYESVRELFEKTEKGAAKKLDSFMKGAEKKYRLGMQNLVYQPGLSITEFINRKTMGGLFYLNVFSNFRSHVRKYFKNPQLVSIMEFPVLFLGAMPQQTPALYSLMNFAGLHVGTYYPMGGFGKVIDAMVDVAREQGVEFSFSQDVKDIHTLGNQVFHVGTKDKQWHADAVIASGDYNQMEKLISRQDKRNYSEEYWSTRTFAPSCLIFYLGVNTRVNKLQHHTLFFDEDLDNHAKEIYQNPAWPENPLFYVCCPSKTDAGVAPPGCENLFVLMPLAPGLPDDETTREKYYHMLMARLEAYTKQPLRQHVIYKRSYCVSDFQQDYYAYKGNAYGLANTLRQTAILKPKIRSKKIKNLFFAGQLTVPGPGVPPAIISGEVSARLAHKHLQKKASYENIVRPGIA